MVIFIKNLFDIPNHPDFLIGIMMAGVIIIELDFVQGFQKCVIHRGLSGKMSQSGVYAPCPVAQDQQFKSEYRAISASAWHGLAWLLLGLS